MGATDLKNLGKHWREAFPDITDTELPGRILKGARYREGLSQVKLPELTGIPQRHISEMETGKRPIGKNNAIKIGKALNLASYKVLL
jgi:plasmid maintenance system antidote protein VapI